MAQIDIFDCGVEYHYKPPITLTKPVRLFEAFAGVGCQAMAFKRAGIPYEHVGISEIDKYAIKSYEAIHGATINYGDITKMETIPPCDCFTWSFPCTDLSKAGKREGLQGGTRSGLVYEVLRLLKATQDKPQVLIMENVPDLVQQAFMAEFYEIRKEIEALGYKNYFQCLNAKDYGVAQNRDRVFMVSILGDYLYEFPMPIPLELRLKDYLEENVDKKYYLTPDAIRKINENSFSQERDRIQDGDVCNALRARDYKGGQCIIDINRESRTIRSGGRSSIDRHSWDLIAESKVIGNVNPSGNGMNGNVWIGNLSPTITTNKGEGLKIVEPFTSHARQENNKIAIPEDTQRRANGDDVGVVTSELRIRKLTERECGRLMGIDDEDITKMQKVVSRSQMYKIFGNGIVVDFFASILKNLYQKENV